MHGATIALNLFLATPMQRETGAFDSSGGKPAVSGPPTDGQPGRECLEIRTAATPLEA